MPIYLQKIFKKKSYAALSALTVKEIADFLHLAGSFRRFSEKHGVSRDEIYLILCKLLKKSENPIEDMVYLVNKLPLPTKTDKIGLPLNLFQKPDFQDLVQKMFPSSSPDVALFNTACYALFDREKERIKDFYMIPATKSLSVQLNLNYGSFKQGHIFIWLISKEERQLLSYTNTPNLLMTDLASPFRESTLSEDFLEKSTPEESFGSNNPKRFFQTLKDLFPESTPLKKRKLNTEQTDENRARELALS